MRTLFAAFGGATNSSKVLLDQIGCPPEDKLCLKNSFTTAPRQLCERLDSDTYDLAILIGQRKMLRDKKAAKLAPLSAIRLETVGRNNRVAYHTEVNFPELAHRLAAAGFSPVISRDAGRYLCNNLYFQAMKYADEKPLKTKIIFLHIPKLRQKPDLARIAAALTENLDEKLLQSPDI